MPRLGAFTYGTPPNHFLSTEVFDTEFKNIIHMTAFVLLIYHKIGMYLSKAPL